MDQIKIFDTTLRDGEQSPGFSMTPGQKLRVAQMLAELGVDVIEAGFPAASNGDFESVQRIANTIKGSSICGLARCHQNDIESVAKALEGAAQKRLHVFIATSPIHREHKLNMSRSEVIERAIKSIHLGCQHFDEIEFSAEDAIRTEPDYLAEVLTAAIDAGATTVNIPDTVGYTTPSEISALFSMLQQQVPNIDQAIISTHCHDDLGLAVANSLAAVKAGARQIECTINGIGERAGNCALEEVVMALKTRAEYFCCDTRINTRMLNPASKLVSGVTGNFVPRNKAVVGKNAFAHESGIHQHGMIANRSTYEIMQPEDVGVSQSALVLGKHSGKHAVLQRAEQLGFKLDNNESENLMVRFKDLADLKKQVFDADIEALITGDQSQHGGPWKIDALRVDTGIGSSSPPSAAVALSREGTVVIREAAAGDGPVDAIFKALQRATGIEMTMTGLSMRSVSEGGDAQGEAEVRALYQGQEYGGHGVSTDIVAACAYALVEIINRVTRKNKLFDTCAA